MNAWARSLNGLERVVADDVRFDNEVAAVREFGGVVIELRRPGLARSIAGHASEAGVVANLLLENGGTSADVSVALDRMLARAAGLYKRRLEDVD